MIENIKDFILLSTDFIHQTLQVDYKGKSVLESVGRTRKCLSRTEYLDRIFGQDIWTGYLDRIFGQDHRKLLFISSTGLSRAIQDRMPNK